jgi:hypothetical protein
LGRPEVDHQIEHRRLLDRQIAGLRAVEDLVDQYGDAIGQPGRDHWPVRHQGSRYGERPALRHRRRSIFAGMPATESNVRMTSTSASLFRDRVQRVETRLSPDWASPGRPAMRHRRPECGDCAVAPRWNAAPEARRSA